MKLSRTRHIMRFALIASAVALIAAPAHAAAPQCKFKSRPSSITYSQGASWQSLLNFDSGVIGARKGHWDAVIDAQENVLRTPGATPHILFMAASSLAAAYWHESKFGPAISAANTALRTQVDDSAAYTQRGIMYFNENDFARSVADETKAIALDPCRKLAYRLRALAYRREHLTKQAIADEAKIVEIDNSYIAKSPTTKAYTSTAPTTKTTRRPTTRRSPTTPR